MELDMSSTTICLYFQENGIWNFMQIVPIGDNLCDMSNPGPWER